MPAYGQDALNYQARNANSVTVMIGDSIVAFAQTSAHSIDFGAAGQYGIGSALPQEIQQLKITPDITITAFALTAAGETLLANGQSIFYLLANNSFDLHIVDGQTETPIFTYVGCVASNAREDITANSLITQSIPFLAMDVLDNNGDSVLNSNSVFSINSGAAVAGAAAGGLGTN